MSIGRITGHTVNAQLDITTTNPTVTMRQQQAQVQIHTELPRVIIDQTECFNTSGLKRNGVLARDIAAKGYQAVLNYISTTANDGDRMADFYKGGNPFIAIAQRNAYPEHTFDVVSMPSARPEIKVTGSIDISFKPKELGVHNGVKIDVRLGSLDAAYIPGKVYIDFKV